MLFKDKCYILKYYLSVEVCIVFGTRILIYKILFHDLHLLMACVHHIACFLVMCKTEYYYTCRGFLCYFDTNMCTCRKSVTGSGCTY